MATPVDYPSCYRWLGFLLCLAIYICYHFRAVGAILIGAVIVGAFLVALGQFADRRDGRKVYYQAIAARADKQHAACLEGKPYGIYGDYPPTSLDERAIRHRERQKYAKDWKWVTTADGRRVMAIRKEQ